MLMSILDIKKFEQIEEIIETVHGAFPHMPKRGRRLITELLPYVIFVLAIMLGFGAVFYTPAHLFKLNKIMLKVVLVLCSGVLIASFKPLSLWMKKGWYNLFYVSLIQLLLTLLFLNVYTLGGLILSWYVLFEIKKEYS